MTTSAIEAEGLVTRRLRPGQPSLDEVFLALTGHAAEPAADDGGRSRHERHDQPAPARRHGLRAPRRRAGGTGCMAIFPLLFLSNIFVEPSTLPAALEWCVGVNPVSHLVTATREIMAGDVDAGHVLLVRGEAALLTAIFAPLTARLYGRAG